MGESIESAQRVVARRSGGRTAENTGRLFDATLEILSAEGLAGVTFAEVGALAGVNRSTLYRRWPNPAALVLEALAARIEARVAVADTGSLRSDLEATMTNLAEFLRSPVGRAGLAAAASLVGDVQAAAAIGRLWSERFFHIGEIFTRAVARGELPNRFDGEALTGAAAGAIYFRLLVAAAPVDTVWIDRVLDTILPHAPGKIVPHLTR